MRGGVSQTPYVLLCSWKCPLVCPSSVGSQDPEENVSLVIRVLTSVLNWCFGTVMLEKTLESPLDCKEIKPINPKRNQLWILNGRTDAESEAPVLWSPDAQSLLIKRDPDVGKDWRQEEKGKREDQMVGWHHWLNGHEFDQTLGDGEGQESLVCCSPRGHKESDTTEQLNNSKNKMKLKQMLLLLSCT